MVKRRKKALISIVAPKKAALAEAEAEYNAVNAMLLEKRAEVEAVEKRLDEMNQRLEAIQTPGHADDHFSFWLEQPGLPPSRSMRCRICASSGLSRSRARLDVVTTGIDRCHLPSYVSHQTFEAINLNRLSWTLIGSPRLPLALLRSPWLSVSSPWAPVGPPLVFLGFV